MSRTRQLTSQAAKGEIYRMKNISKSIIITGMLALTPVLAASPASAASLDINKVLPSHGNEVIQACSDNNFKLLQQGNGQWEQHLSDILNKLMQQKPALDVANPSPSPDNSATPPVAEEKPEVTPQPEVTAPEAAQPEVTVPEVLQPEVGTEPAKEETQTDKTDQSEDTNVDFAQQVVDLVNQERAKAGLKALQNDAALTNVAMIKAKDMYNNNYFDHHSPTLGSPFDLMKSEGVQYRTAGENIAKGQKTPEEVMKAWMNSEGHRQNIMNPNYTSIGVAYYNGEWVQEFTG